MKKAKKNEEPKNINEVLETAKVTTKQKERKPRKKFKDIILAKIDQKAKNTNANEYFELREKLKVILDDIELLIDREKQKSKIEKNTFKRLSKFTEADIRAYLSQINEEK